MMKMKMRIEEDAAIVAAREQRAAELSRLREVECSACHQRVPTDQVLLTRHLARCSQVPIAVRTRAQAALAAEAIRG